MTKKLSLFLAIFMPPIIPAQEIAVDEISGKMIIKAFQTLCIDCHSGPKPKAKFDMENLGPKITGPDIQHWENILEMVSIGDMPPEDETQPTGPERDLLVAWITKELEALGQGPVENRELYPRYGNRVSHEKLFSGEHKGPGFSRPRLWRIGPDFYEQFINGVDYPTRGISSPLNDISSEGILDYDLLSVDEATIATMIQNKLPSSHRPSQSPRPGSQCRPSHR